MGQASNGGARLAAGDDRRRPGAAVRRAAGAGGQRPVPVLLEPIYDAFPEMAERREQPASRLSGGQQQSLAVAQGLVAKPRLLILDESSTGLAPLLVEQFVEKALLYADHCTILDHGHIVGSGTPATLQDAGTIQRIYLGA